MNENARKAEYLVEQRTEELPDTNKQLGNEQRKQVEEILAGHVAKEAAQSEAHFRTMFETSAMG